MFQKKAPNNIFIIKPQNLKMRGVKILGVLIKFMKQNFSRSPWGPKILGYNFFLGGGFKFRTSQKFRFPTIIIFVIFGTGGKNSLEHNQ